MSLDRMIQVKELLFQRTILVMDDDDIFKRILVTRSNEFNENIAMNRRNELRSPIFDILNTSILVGLYDVCMRIMNTGCFFLISKW